MKKIIVATLLSLSTLMGSEYTKEDRIKDMHEMAQAMDSIQSGFFFNNYDSVAAGVDKLRNAIVKVQPPVEEVAEKDMLAKYMNQKVQMTDKIVKKINKRSFTLLERFKDGDSAQALQEYSKIMAQCMTCHREIRNW